MATWLFPYSDGKYTSDLQHLRSMRMRVQSGLAMLACYLLMGCAQPPVTREAVVGSYAYISEDPESRATDHAWDRLTLQADGKYELVQGRPTKPRSETAGTCTLEAVGANSPEVVLDHSGYPVEMTRNEIRLLIDLDAGIWYAKPR